MLVVYQTRSRLRMGRIAQLDFACHAWGRRTEIIAFPSMWEWFHGPHASRKGCQPLGTTGDAAQANDRATYVFVHEGMQLQEGPVILIRRGLRTCRSPSPNKLKPKATKLSARPG